MEFRVRTAPPKGRNTWEPDTAAKIQTNLFTTVAVLAAASGDAEQKLMDMIAEAKAGKIMIPVAG